MRGVVGYVIFTIKNDTQWLLFKHRIRKPSSHAPQFLSSQRPSVEQRRHHNKATAAARPPTIPAPIPAAFGGPAFALTEGDGVAVAEEVEVQDTAVGRLVTPTKV